MQRKIGVWSGIFAVAAIISSAACSSSSSSAASVGTKSAFVDAYCAAMSACCGSAQLPTDGVQCHSYMNIDPGAYDPAMGQTCINEMQAAGSADASWCMGTTANPACSSVLSALFTDPDHTAGTRGKQGDSCTVSIIDDPTGNNFGAIASDSDVFCANDDGLYCDLTSKQCMPVAADGGACTTVIGGCGVGETCSAGVGAGTCGAIGKIGDACPNFSCALGVAHCDSTKTCVADLAAGAACVSTDNSCASLKCTSGSCEASQGSSFVGLQNLCGPPATN